MKLNKINHETLRNMFLALIVCLLIFYLYNYMFQKIKYGSEFFSSTFIVPEKRKILILYTGGTIGMVESKDGNVPKRGFLKQQMDKILAMHKNRREISPFTIKEYDPLLDSSNMSISNWNKMIVDIRDNYDKYDSFIVIHGTDTLSYTASALSFALEGLSKPVIITGSQIPLEQLKNDGGNNLLSSLIVASSSTIPEVMVVFSNKIIRGNRSKKISSNKLDAFESPNLRNIGNFGYAAKPNYSRSMIRTAGMGTFHAQLYDEKKEVCVVFLTPGFNFKNVETMVAANPNIRGVILQTFGIGDGPTGNDDFLHMLKVLNDKDITILNISQCIEGHIDTGDYETGSTMVKYNVISGSDMTLEAGYCKLLYLLSRYENGEQLYSNAKLIENDLVRDLRGELSEKSTSFEFF